MGAACAGVVTVVLMGSWWICGVDAAMASSSDIQAASAAAAAAAGATPTVGEVMRMASAKAFKGGLAGFAAGVVQVGTFMWLRTAMNFQYANGGTLRSTLKRLWGEGGIPRFYQGVSIAIVQAPLSRFGDTAANTGVLAAMDVFFPTMPPAVKSIAVSTAGASWRILLTPLDTFKTTKQVRGDKAVALLMERVRQKGPGQLYSGAFAIFAASWAGSYPWFATFNTLQATLPPAEGSMGLVRTAVCGMCASGVSDTITNSVRVLKTVRQTSPDPNMDYMQAARSVVSTDGWTGLLSRGLGTRLLVNICQGVLFSVVWKAIEAQLIQQ